MAKHDATKSQGQGNRTRPKQVVVAVPLLYSQKAEAKDDTMKNNDIMTTVVEATDDHNLVEHIPDSPFIFSVAPVTGINHKASEHKEFPAYSNDNDEAGNTIEYRMSPLLNQSSVATGNTVHEKLSSPLPGQDSELFCPDGSVGQSGIVMSTNLGCMSDSYQTGPEDDTMPAQADRKPSENGLGPTKARIAESETHKGGVSKAAAASSDGINLATLTIDALNQMAERHRNNQNASINKLPTVFHGQAAIAETAAHHPASTRILGRHEVRQDAVPSLREDTDRRQHWHHSHPSQGSMRFGSYPVSVHSSPAPQPVPPQAMHPAMNGFPRYPPGLGFSPYLTPQILQSPGQNNLALHHHPESFGPSPSGTPGIEHYQLGQQSPAFHASHAQTPPPNAHRTGYGQVPSPPMLNGGNGQPQNMTLYSFPGDLFTGPPMQPHEAGDALDGLVNYIQSQFNNPGQADFQLEVRFTSKNGMQHLPLQMPGHKLLLARSPRLRHLMAGGFKDVVYKGTATRFITLDLDDNFVRPDSVWIAIQRLYGGALLTMNTLPDPSLPRTTESNTTLETEKLDLALGYAAAGHILQMEPVVHRGIQVACHYLDWNTLLRVLDFADAILDLEIGGNGGMDNGVGLERKYGPASEFLMSAGLGFIIANFPATFKLDTSVPDAEHFRRLPKSESFRKHHQKLSEMRFGEFRLDDDATHVNALEPESPRSMIRTTLSKVLINLPFPLLKYVVESHNLGGNTKKWDTIQRVQLMHDVVQEREARRVQAAKRPQPRPQTVTQGSIGFMGDTQQQRTLWWFEQVAKRGEGGELVRELLRSPLAHELPA